MLVREPYRTRNSCERQRGGGNLTRSAQSARTLALLDPLLAEHPTPVRRERLVAYTLILTSLFADRAALMESQVAPALDDEEFGRTQPT